MFIEIPASRKSLAFRKPVFERGVIDVDYITHTKQGTCPYFIRWRNMLSRCYSENRKDRDASYHDCDVSREWLSLKNFKSWMEKQDWEGKHLDKDLLVSGNRTYSPSLCLLIDGELNMFLSKVGKVNGYTIKKGRKKKYISQISIDGRSHEIGRFYTKEEAVMCYKKAKTKLIIEKANKYKEDPVIHDALIRIANSL
jgi:hypothetical protein